MQLEFSGRFSSGLALLDTNVEQLEIVATASGTFLYSATGVNGGIVAYRIGATGQPTVADSFYFTSTMRSMGGLELGWAQFGTQQRLIFGVSQSGDLLAANTSGPGDLGSAATVMLEDSQSPWLQNGLLTTELSGGADMIYVADALSGGLHGYRIGATGSLTHVSAEASPSGGAVIGTVLLEMVTLGGADYLLRADCGVQGVVCYAVAANGTLEQMGSLGASNGLGVNVPTALATVSVWGQTFVLLGAAESGTLSAMRLSATGSLIPTDHLLDTLDTRFGGITALEVVQTAGRVFILAGGADDGLSLFTILPDGRLVHLQTLVHQTGFGLENVQSIAATVVGDEIRVFVASGTATGLTRLSIDLSTLGISHNGGTSGATQISGSALDDLLISNSSGSDSLLGGAGDDILVSGPGETCLYGGTGNDLFVIRAAQSRQFVMDYAAGDRIDLSGLPMLHSTAQLTATPTSRGILLTYFGYEIEIVSRDGRPLSLANIWSGLSFGLPDRVIVLGEMPGERLMGTTLSERLEGGLGSDTILGDSGDDTLLGAEAGDSIDGANGNDQLDGGAGNDTLWGRNGNDYMLGGDGLDSLVGAAGNDTLIGGADADHLLAGEDADRVLAGAGDDRAYGGGGNDTLDGGAGNDTVAGGGNDDQIEGGSGNDRLTGDWGNDVLTDSLGDDSLSGGNGNDRLTDTAGNNQLSGGPGADTITGGSGNDLITGGADRATSHDLADSLQGGAGADTLLGGYGADTLRGDAGADSLEGGPGNDALFGGADNDTLSGGDGNDVLSGGSGRDAFAHNGAVRSGADVISDFDGLNDTLIFTNTRADAGDFTLRWQNTGGDAALRDAVIVYEPTGEAVWTLLDTYGQAHLWVQIGTTSYDLLA